MLRKICSIEFLKNYTLKGFTLYLPRKNHVLAPTSRKCDVPAAQCLQSPRDKNRSEYCLHFELHRNRF